MKADQDKLTFSTGKTVYANRGIVGLCIDEESQGGLSYGSDGRINLPGDTWAPPEKRLTPGECVELADAMLKLWAEFRAKYAKD